MRLTQYSSDVLVTEDVDRLAIHADDSIFRAMTTIEAAPTYGLPSGMALVVDNDARLVGVITDGDIRDALIKAATVETPVRDVMTNDPIKVSTSVPPHDVLDDIRRQIESGGRPRTIRHAVLVDDQHRVQGLIDVGQLAQNLSLQRDTVGVIGMGFVGLTLALTLAESGYKVYGWDTNPVVMSGLQQGTSHVHELGLDRLLTAQLERRQFVPAHDYDQLRDCGIFVIAVNTPVIGGTPDLTFVRAATTDLCNILKPGALVMLRSTVPIGTCRDVVKPIIEDQTAYHVGRDVGLVFAPERTVQGDALAELRALPQVIGGINSWSTEVAARFFARFAPIIVRANTLEDAEMIKLLNNTFRDISFAFANEIALLCEEYNLDAARVVHTANTGYPRNPIAWPSPGVGGACLSKDPYILASSQRDHEGIPPLAQVARHINELMPRQLAERLLNAFEQMGKESADCKVFVAGLAFKGEPETNDLRGSPALATITALQGHVGEIVGYDPVIERTVLEQCGIVWQEIETGFANADAVLIMNNHRSFAQLDIHTLVKTMASNAVVFDGWRHFTDEDVEQEPGVRYMSLGYLTPWRAPSP